MEVTLKRPCWVSMEEVEGLVSRMDESWDRPLVVSDLGCLCGCPVTVRAMCGKV